jgi:hypothetical protein
MLYDLPNTELAMGPHLQPQEGAARRHRGLTCLGTAASVRPQLIGAEGPLDTSNISRVGFLGGQCGGLTP